MATNNSRIENVQNKVVAHVIDRQGVVIDTREMRNILFPQLHGDLDFAFIDWKSGQGRKWHPTAATLSQPIRDTRPAGEQRQPGLPWYGALAWGSSVKSGMTIALKTDVVKEDGFAFKGEDALRYGRAKFAQGNWGLARWAKCRVLVVPPGTKFGDFEVRDGVGVACTDDFEQIRLGDGGHLKIQMRPDGQSSQVAQRISFAQHPAAREEVLQAVQATMQNMLDPEKRFRMYRQSILRGQEGGFRRDLARIDDEMLKHPYVNLAWSAGTAERLRRLASALPLHSRMFVAIPADVRNDTIGYRHLLTRFPVETYGQIGAYDGELTDAEKAEAKRVAQTEVVQVSLWMENKFFSKGNLQLVDRSVMPAGVDIVICSKDVKMMKSGDAKKLGKVHASGGEFIGCTWVTVVQYWARGQAFGVNAEVWEGKYNADWDGDLGQVSDTTEFPAVHEAAATLPGWSQKKLVKTSNPLSDRCKLAANAMVDVVGSATNLMSATFAWAERDIMAVMLGRSGEGDLEVECGLKIKYGTDGWKSDYDLHKVARDVSIIMRQVEGLLGGVYPPNHWKRSAVMFAHKIPLVEGYAPHDAIWAAMSVEEQKAFDAEGGYLRKSLNGTVPEIARLVLPDLHNIVEVGMEVNLLSHYIDWAPAQTANPKLDEAVALVIQRFGSTISRVNLADIADTTAFKHNFQEYVDASVKAAGVSRIEFAYALWREAHSSREARARGSAIFMGMPAEAEAIVREKPGLKVAAAKRAPVKMLGYDMVMADPNSPRQGVAVVVKAVNYKGVSRMAIVAVRPLPGQKKPSAGLPINCLGLVAKESAQPREGEYIADIARNGKDKCWLVTLK